MLLLQMGHGAKRETLALLFRLGGMCLVVDFLDLCPIPIPIPSYRRATAHAQALLALAQKATAQTEEAIPDGLVPARLPPLLRAMGVAGCDVQATVVNLIGVQCKGAANLEKTAAHRDAVNLHEIGVHLDGVHRHTTETVQCHLCGAASTRLQRVRAGARGSQSTRLVA